MSDGIVALLGALNLYKQFSGAACDSSEDQQKVQTRTNDWAADRRATFENNNNEYDALPEEAVHERIFNMDKVRETGFKFDDSIIPACGISLEGAMLANAKFIYFDLANGDFRNADLTDSRFWDGNLEGADFRGAKIDGLEFWNTSLDGAKFDIEVLLDPDFHRGEFDNARFFDKDGREVIGFDVGASPGLIERPVETLSNLAAHGDFKTRATPSKLGEAWHDAMVKAEYRDPEKFVKFEDTDVWKQLNEQGGESSAPNQGPENPSTNAPPSPAG